MDMVNSIADMSIAMAGNQLMTNVSTAVLDMTMDTYQEQAAELTKMKETSVPPHLGQHIDMTI